jgi:hypothetical protein
MKKYRILGIALIGVVLILSITLFFVNGHKKLGTYVDSGQVTTFTDVNVTNDLVVDGDFSADRLTGLLYENETGSTVGSLKLHNHLTTADYNTQLRSESIKTSGTHWGIDSETYLNASGTASIIGVQGVANLSAGFTSTAGTLIGTYGQVRSDGTFNAAGGFLAGLYGLIEASSTTTASHMAAIWADSHQNNPVTGEHELIYASNNGLATMDSVIYVYGGNKITNLLNLSTVTGMVENTATTSGTSKKIKINIDGTTYYINAYSG